MYFYVFYFPYVVLCSRMIETYTYSRLPNNLYTFFSLKECIIIAIASHCSRAGVIIDYNRIQSDSIRCKYLSYSLF